MLAEVNGIAPIVIRNDDFGGNFSVAWSTFKSEIVEKIKCERMNSYANEEFMLNIVISPGPGTPSVSSDFGMCANALRLAEVPILGICLGHQGLAYVYGGNVTNAKEVMHGRTSRVFHQENHEPLFKYIPNGFEVVRYHSLVVTEPLPDDLVVVAKTQDDIIMALKHIKEPKFGVQFHPEAVCSQFGYQIFQNFRDLTLGQAFSPCILHHGDHKMNIQSSKLTDRILPRPSRYQVYVKKLPEMIPGSLDFAAYVFQHLYGAKEQSFWLDSSNHLQVSSNGTSNSRFSFMGDASGPLYQCVEYFALSNMTRVYTKENVKVLKKSHVLSYLQEQLDQFMENHQVISNESEPLPFEFRGGFVGYLGYETLENGLNDPKDLSTQNIKEAMTKDSSQNVPDASFLFADRVIIFDHETNGLYLLCMVDKTLISSDTHDEWFRKMNKCLKDLKQVFETTSRQPISPPPPFSLSSSAAITEPIRFYPSRSKKQYMNDILEAQEKIHNGDTYEVCLTNQLKARCQIEDPLAFYSLLRQRNPAPYAAFYRIKKQTKQDESFKSYTICCSSPERFLKVDANGWIESKPIKGTRRRGQTAQEDAEIAFELANCIKDRAENMMIADLVRNDLGIVCEVGSVHVPKLMHVETYATVHQLVTTVRGQRAPKMKNVDIIKAIFPGGSMTGAPKKRTMEIIRFLEKNPRGVYSGAMGFFSINNCMDLNIIIRTVVVTPMEISLGSGGAIVALSNIEEEYEEMLLKTKALIKTIGLYCRGDENQGAIIEIDTLS
jgi:para-aminobenzoate synthetase